MKTNRGLLFITLCFGLLLHFGGIYWLDQHPLVFRTQRFENLVAKHEANADIWERQKRSQMLSESFNAITEVEPEVKLELHELRAEFAPQLELDFPREGAIDFSTNGLFADHFDTKLVLDEASFGPEAGSSLIAPMEGMRHLPAPPLAFLEVKNETLEELGTLASSEHFDIEVEYAPKRSRPGYVFRITLLPHNDVHFKRIRQNFFFLLDRSNSIPRARFALNKKAVAEALDFLKPGDRFNILLFDDHVLRYRAKEVDWSPSTVAEAREFLEHQGHGGYFAATELYASLGKIIPQDVAEDEINTAILVSDGDTYLSTEKQRLTIGGWTAQNGGKITLYTLASGTGNNLSLLELLSTFNKGALIYAQEHQKVGERLAYLMRTLQNPIGKHIVATAVPEDSGMSVLLQPKPSRMPDLYQNRPFVIYGTTNKLSDFVIFLQGKYYGRHFDIKKHVTFEQAKIGSYSVERGWTQLVAQEFYERYFAEGNQAHLEAAKQLLVPLNLPTPLME